MRSLREEDLEQHSLEVAVLAHALALIRRDVFGDAMALETWSRESPTLLVTSESQVSSPDT